MPLGDSVLFLKVSEALSIINPIINKWDSELPTPIFFFLIEIKHMLACVLKKKSNFVCYLKFCLK